MKKSAIKCISAEAGTPPGGGHSLTWAIRGCAAGQGMVFDLAVLNRVYNLTGSAVLNGI